MLALSGLLAGLAVPSLAGIWDRSRSRGATREVASTLRSARSRAIAEGRYIGVQFVRAEGGWLYGLFADGDDDGILSADIAAGIDRRLGRWQTLASGWPGVDFGFIARDRIRKLPPSTGWMSSVVDPVQCGSSDILSFSPQGTASSGTVYISNGRGEQTAIVLYGPTARLRVYRYDTGVDEWVF